MRTSSPPQTGIRLFPSKYCAYTLYALQRGNHMKRVYYFWLAAILALAFGLLMFFAPGFRGNAVPAQFLARHRHDLCVLGSVELGLRRATSSSATIPMSDTLKAVLWGSVAIHGIGFIGDLWSVQLGTIALSGVAVGLVAHLVVLIGAIFYLWRPNAPLLARRISWAKAGTGLAATPGPYRGQEPEWPARRTQARADRCSASCWSCSPHLPLPPPIRSPSIWPRHPAPVIVAGVSRQCRAACIFIGPEAWPAPLAGHPPLARAGPSALPRRRRHHHGAGAAGDAGRRSHRHRLSRAYFGDAPLLPILGQRVSRIGWIGAAFGFLRRIADCPPRRRPRSAWCCLGADQRRRLDRLPFADAHAEPHRNHYRHAVSHRLARRRHLLRAVDPRVPHATPAGKRHGSHACGRRSDDDGPFSLHSRLSRGARRAIGAGQFMCIWSGPAASGGWSSATSPTPGRWSA